MRVLVVGAGISGLFIAYSLARRGVEVTIVEKEYPGAGSTGRCATGIRASFTSREHVELMKRSIELWREYSRGELGEHGLKYVESGYLWIARRVETLERLRELEKMQNSLGVPTKVVDASTVERLAPLIDASAVAGALYDPIAGKSYVFDTLRALLRVCRSMGVEMVVGKEVTGFRVSNERVVEAQTSDGSSIRADYFVIAAGAESRELLKRLGIDVPIKNIPRHIVATEQFREVLEPLVIDWDTPGAPYIVQVGDGAFLMGRDIEDEPEAPLYSERIDFYRAVLAPLTRLFPFLKRVRIVRYWIGYYVTTPDNHPVYGPIPGIENLLVATGFSGHGYMLGPITGEIIAQWIVSGDPGIEAAKRLTIERFERGELVKELAVVG